jgi:GNAT superfamily N-acetyltransferase
MPVDLVDVAENASGLTPGIAVERRQVRPEMILIDQLGPASMRLVVRLRLGQRGVDDHIAGVRAWFAEAGRNDFTWIVGTTSTPADLAERLVAAGALPSSDDPEMAALVLTEEPERVDSVDVRVSSTFSDSLIGRDLIAEVLGLQGDDVPSDEQQRKIWEAGRHTDWRTFLAYVDGKAVGRASCASTTDGPVQLSNACVLPEYRGRGIYRALVRARWDEAVRRGSHVLVTQAGALSRPILERSGFKVVGAIRRLEDRTDRTAAQAS